MVMVLQFKLFSCDIEVLNKTTILFEILYMLGYVYYKYIFEILYTIIIFKVIFSCIFISKYYVCLKIEST